MTLKVSTGARDALLATSPLRDIVGGMVMRLYAGAQPSTADAALGAATLLCEISVNGDGTGVSFETSATSGVLRKEPVESWYGPILTSGTATFFRMEVPSDDGSLSTTALRLQGTVASAGGDAYLPNTSLIQGGSQAIDYFSVAVPASL